MMMMMMMMMMMILSLRLHFGRRSTPLWTWWVKMDGNLRRLWHLWKILFEQRIYSKLSIINVSLLGWHEYKLHTKKTSFNLQPNLSIPGIRKNQAKSTNNQQTPHVFHEKSLKLRTLVGTERNFRAFKDFCGQNKRAQAANVGINRVNLQTQQVWRKLLEWVEILAVSCRYHCNWLGGLEWYLQLFSHCM